MLTFRILLQPSISNPLSSTLNFLKKSREDRYILSLNGLMMVKRVACGVLYKGVDATFI
jgi:hypothetical protein